MQLVGVMLITSSYLLMRSLADFERHRDHRNEWFATIAVGPQTADSSLATRQRRLVATQLPSTQVTIIPLPSSSPTTPTSASQSPDPTPSKIPDFNRQGYIQFQLYLPALRVDGEACYGLISWLLASGSGNILRQLLADAHGVSLWQVLFVSAQDNAGAFVTNAPGTALASLNANYFVPVEALRCSGSVDRRLRDVMMGVTSHGGFTRQAEGDVTSQQLLYGQPSVPRHLQDLTDGVDLTLTVRILPFDVRSYTGAGSEASVTRLTSKLMALNLKELMRQFFSEWFGCHYSENRVTANLQPCACITRFC